MKLFNRFLTAFGKTPYTTISELHAVTLQNDETKYPLLVLKARDHQQLLKTFISDESNPNECTGMFQYLKIINSVSLTLIVENKKIIIEFNLNDDLAHSALFGIYNSGKIGIREIDSPQNSFFNLESVLRDFESDWIDKIQPVIFRETFKIASQQNEEMSKLSTEQIDSIREKMPEMYREILGTVEAKWLKN